MSRCLIHQFVYAISGTHLNVLKVFALCEAVIDSKAPPLKKLLIFLRDVGVKSLTHNFCGSCIWPPSLKEKSWGFSCHVKTRKIGKRSMAVWAFVLCSAQKQVFLRRTEGRHCVHVLRLSLEQIDRGLRNTEGKRNLHFSCFCLLFACTYHGALSWSPQWA